MPYEGHSIVFFLRTSRNNCGFAPIAGPGVIWHDRRLVGCVIHRVRVRCLAVVLIWRMVRQRLGYALVYIGISSAPCYFSSLPSALY